MITLRNFNQYMVHITGIWILEIGRNQKKKKKEQSISQSGQNQTETSWFLIDFSIQNSVEFIQVSYLVKFIDQRKKNNIISKQKVFEGNSVTFFLSHYLFINKWSKE